MKLRDGKLTDFFFFFQNHRVSVFIVLLITYVGLGVYGYYLSFPSMPFWEKVYRTTIQFALQSDFDFFKSVNYPEKGKEINADGYVWILWSAWIAIVTFALGAFLLFAENIVVYCRTLIIKSSFTHNHIIVIGLDRSARAYIDNEIDINKRHIIIVEHDTDNPYLRKYKEKAIGVVIGNATDQKILKKLNLQNSEHIFISAGSDEKNIEIALETVEILKINKGKNVKLIISLTPQGKRHYYTNEGLLDIKDDTVDIRVFSFADEAARILFEEHEIDGIGLDIIKSDSPFALMVIGSGDLAVSIIYHAAMIASMPNRNLLTIYCVDDEKGSLKRKIDYLYHGIKNIKKLRMVFLSEYHISSIKPDYQYFQEIKNIVVCNDDQESNIEIATDLVERVYRHQNESPKILAAIYDMNKIASRIDDNNNLHRNIFAFADSQNICSIMNIANQNKYKIAMYMHMCYDGEFDENKINLSEEDLIKEWKKIAISDKESNLAQTYHISLKLKALGLKILRHRHAEDSAKDLLEKNRKKMDAVLNQDIEIGELFDDIRIYKKLLEKSDELESVKTELCVEKEEKLYEIVDKYFPNDFSSLLKKLVNCEHERWNNYHYLNNWKNGKTKQKNLKMHNCLKPFSDFNKNEKKTVIYDIFSILYLPNYCAQVGWELIDYSIQENNTSTKKIKKIGVTGHRDIEETDELKNRVETVLSNLGLAEECEIITALADGADMFVTEIAIEKHSEKLKVKVNVILPYEKDQYIKSINKNNRERFEFLLAKNSEARTCEWIGCAENEEDQKKEQYELCGRKIVNECDVLIALYDGEESRGKGGTAEIVEYAREKKRIVKIIDVKRKNNMDNK